MASASLNTTEKIVLHYWIADQAPGYNNNVVMNQLNRATQLATLKASDLVAINNLDNDVLRGYLSPYLVQKQAQMSIYLTKLNKRVASVQSDLADVQNDITTLTGAAIQAVPTTGS